MYEEGGPSEATGRSWGEGIALPSPSGSEGKQHAGGV